MKIWLLFGLALLGCQSQRVVVDRTEAKNLEIVRDSIRIETGPIGHAHFEDKATHVLLEVKNNADYEIVATIGGDLVDDDNRKVGSLILEPLHIPAGKRRLFNPVAKSNAVLPNASGVAPRIVGARKVKFPRQLKLIPGVSHPHDDKYVVSGWIENPTKRHAAVTVLAAFYDQNGRALQRKYVVLKSLIAGGRTPIEIVGPSGAKDGFLYLGESVFP